MKSKFLNLGILLTAGLMVWACGPKDKTAAAQEIPLTAPHEEAEAWAEKTLAGLTLHEKAAQMICEQMRGDIPEDGPEFAKLLELVRDQGVGAFVIYGGSPAATAGLINRLQQASALPLFFSADFEGGPGQQLQGATEFPGNMALSAIDSEEIAYRLGKAGAAEGRAVGIHITYSPVVDVQTRPENPVLSVRSFGTDIDRLGRLAGAYIRGYQENGMLATAKHYPGRGDVDLIPGTEYTVNNKPADRVENEDFRAFKLAIEAGVTYIMSEHISVPSVTEGSDLPASVEKKLATDWLKNRLGFTGILTTDDMWYPKVVERFGPVKACIMAVQAGHDAVLKPADAAAVIDGLTAAVESGEIPESRIDESVKKILYWKARLNLHNNRLVDLDRISEVVGNPEHRELLKTIADSSLTVLVNRGFFPVESADFGAIVHVSVQKKPADPNPGIVAGKLSEAFEDITHFAIGAEKTSPDVSDAALQAAKSADLIIVSLFNPRTVYTDNGPLQPQDLALLQAIIAAKPEKTLVMSYGNPYLVEGMENATAFLVGYGEGGFYGNQTIYADSLIRLLRNQLTPKGILPVHISEKFPLGAGITY